MSKSSVFQSVSVTESDLPNLLTQIQTSKTDAANSAAAAATSAASVATAASQAATEATNASNEATAAANSATAAAGSASAAATSETNASAHVTSASNHVSSAATSATSATNSQSAANISATNAATSETNAATSATNAATSATNAATSETNAATSANSAATSVTNAQAEVTNAQTEVTNATNQANAAATSAAAASSSASAASTSETNAQTHSNTASGHATSASTQATNAATSATNAATAETNAGTQATNAGTSATAAAGSATNAATAQTAAESARDSALAAFDSFDDRYLGSKTSDPSNDNDGNTLVAGTLYFNSSTSTMMLYTGSAWVAAYVSGGSFAQLSGATFTGDVTVPNLITSGNVDGRDVSADGAKLDGIETAATADQTAAEIRTLVESATDSNVFTDNDHAKLNGIATGATAVSSLTDLSISDGTNGQALKTDGAGNFSFGDVASSTAFADVTGKPTTLSGYGITDALPNNANGVTTHPLRVNGGQFRVGDTSWALCISTNNQGASGTVGHTAAQNEGIHWHTSKTSYGIFRTAGAWTAPTYSQLEINFPTGIKISTASRGTYTYAHTNIEQSLNVGSDVQIGTQSVLSGLGQLGLYRSANPYIAWYSGSTSRGAYQQYVGSSDSMFFGEIANLQSAGNVTAYASDERLKKDFAKLENALEKVCSLEGVTYQWDKEKCEKVGFKTKFELTEIGLRAQQVQEHFPEVVTAAPFDLDEDGNSTSGDDYLTMYYDRLVPVLIEAIKELKAEVEELKSGCCGCQS